MTRFGEISPLGQNVKMITRLCDSLICNLKKFEPTLENSVCFGPICIVVNGQILRKHSRHLVTLVNGKSNQVRCKDNKPLTYLDFNGYLVIRC